MKKISEILSDEESLKQLTELAQMFMSENGEEKSNEKSGDDKTPDLSEIIRLTSLAGAFSDSDINIELLLALKPHLSEERQKRVDKAIKLLRIFSVYSVAKENGLLEDII